jgi:4-carboxymuconolactone decarboxylase
LLIGALAATGKHDILDIQLDAAYRLGELDDAALREIVIFLAHYCGWPTAATLNGQVEKLIAKHRKDTDD